MSLKRKTPPRRSDEEDDSDLDTYCGREYQETLMYGHYTKDLESYAREEASRIKRAEKAAQRESIASGLRPNRSRATSTCLGVLGAVWRSTFARMGEEWVFLALLGSTTAVLSFLMDFVITMFLNTRLWLFRHLLSHSVLQYLAWVTVPIMLIFFCVVFVHLLSPQSAGSGIPEMKTILKGVVLKEYLTFKTLVAKVFGITFTLGAGLPLGKEGPFVHIGCLLATQFSKLIKPFRGIYEDDTRSHEMLAVACGVGVACSLSSPVGGVLYSIEVTSLYFAVKNYWRAFFASICGSVVFQLLEVWFRGEATLTPLFKSYFQNDYPFDPQELFAFALLGVVCGFLGAFFVWLHRRYVIFMRREKIKAFFQKNRLLYPFTITLLYSSLTFPPGLGQFFATELDTHHHMVEFFSNVTWSNKEHTVQEFELVENWRTQWTSVFVNLTVYIVVTFLGVIVTSTLPVPSGLFIPLIKLGAGVGRLAGEIMAATFPKGLGYRGREHAILAGSYSVVGAAALTGAGTHTMSSAVIVLELSGQITHIIPVLIAVVIANAVAQPLEESIYESTVKLKGLPYVPEIVTANSIAYNIYVEDFMMRDIKFIWYGITYIQLRNILREHKKIRSLPLVDSPGSMILLGSIRRNELISLLEKKFVKGRRIQVISKLKLATQKRVEDLQNEEKNKEEKKLAIPNDIAESKTKMSSPIPPAGLSCTDGDQKTTLQANKTAASTTISPPPSNSSGQTHTTTNNVTAVFPPSTDTPLPSATVGSSTEYDKLKERRPSRFEVTQVETPNDLIETSFAVQIDSEEDNTLPKKSILKKRKHSLLLHPVSPSTPLTSSQHTPYAAVHAGISKLGQAVGAVLRRRSLRKTDEKSDNINHDTSDGTSKSASQPQEGMVEMEHEEHKLWEEEEGNKEVDFSKCQIDPAPFQLTERTSLLRTYSLFSMLGLSLAYVTAIGRIIGVVGLKELRKAVEDSNSGEFEKMSFVSVTTSEESDPSSSLLKAEVKE